MKNEEVGHAFMAELRALLAKYNAQIVADDHWQGYAECGEDVRMEVEFDDWNAWDVNLGRIVTSESDYSKTKW